MKHTPLLSIPLLFTSCSSSSFADWGIVSIIVLFALMLVMFGLTVFFIFKKKRQADRSMAKYNRDLNNALSKFDTPEQKIDMLKVLIQRIEADEKYKKDTDWKNKVLVNTYIPMAAQYYKMGDEAQALGICSDIIELDPEHAMSYYNRGSIYSNMGMYEKALADLDKTIELTPYYASAYNNRGLVYYKLDEYEKAIADYDKAISLEDSAISYYNRANAYYASEEPQKALDDFIQFLESDQGDDAEMRTDVESVIQLLKEQLGV